MKDRTKKAQKLLDECNAIFSESIKREVTFHDANVADHWGREPPAHEYFEEPWTCWKDIPDEILDKNSYLLSFFDFDEILFYVPAFIRITIKDEILPNYDLQCDFGGATLAFIGKHFDKLSKFNLNAEQIAFIHKFVEFFLEDKEFTPWLHCHRKTPIKNVLFKY